MRLLGKQDGAELYMWDLPCHVEIVLETLE